MPRVGSGSEGIEEALERLGEVGRNGAALGRIRRMLDEAQRGNAACWTMKTQLDRAQRTFGEIQALIRPVVASVDGTQDKAWLESLAQLKAQSITYFGLRRQLRSGDFAGSSELTRLLDEQQALRERVAALARRQG